MAVAVPGWCHCHFMYIYSQLIATRKMHKEAFLKKHGVKLGFMSAFLKAASFAHMDQPVVNAGEFVLLNAVFLRTL